MAWDQLTMITVTMQYLPKQIYVKLFSHAGVLTSNSSGNLHQLHM